MSGKRHAGQNLLFQVRLLDGDQVPGVWVACPLQRGYWLLLLS